MQRATKRENILIVPSSDPYTKISKTSILSLPIDILFMIGIRVGSFQNYYHLSRTAKKCSRLTSYKERYQQKALDFFTVCHISNDGRMSVSLLNGKHCPGPKNAYNFDKVKQWWLIGDKYYNHQTTKKWYQHGILHNKDGPAFIWNDFKKWYINGELHREDGPAIEYANGAKAWLIRGQLHREDGPAIEGSGENKRWYQNNQRHREDGPAVIFANGDKEWWLNGIQVPKF